MKACSHNRQPIACLALGVLDAPEERLLRVHLETCAECRRYLEEISKVAGKLAAAEIRTDIQTSESFHQKWVQKLREKAPAPLGDDPFSRFRGSWLNWLNQGVFMIRARRRVALPLIGVTVAIIAVWSVLVWRSGISSPAPTPAPVLLTKKLHRDPEPTLANYQIIANQSLEDLDALLTRQATSNASAAPVYSALGSARAAGLD
jgi:hypothetical protein